MRARAGPKRSSPGVVAHLRMVQFTLVSETVGRSTGRYAGRSGPNANGRHVRSPAGALQGDGLAGAEAPADNPLEGEAKVL